MRDVAQVRDGYPCRPTSCARTARRAALLTVLKNGQASTLDIVKQRQSQRCRRSWPRCLPALAVRPAVRPVACSCAPRSTACCAKAAIAAGLTGLMILLFLGSWRSTLIVCISIPLSILTSCIVLWRAGPHDQRHDARRPGAGGRHPGGRRHGRNRKRPPQHGHGEAASRAPFSTARSRSPCRPSSPRWPSASCSSRCCC